VVAPLVVAAIGCSGDRIVSSFRAIDDMQIWVNYKPGDRWH